MGIFSDNVASLNDLAEGDTIAIPNDDTNLSRALRVLAQTGIITLDDSIDASKATVADIAENTKNLVCFNLFFLYWIVNN